MAASDAKKFAVAAAIDADIAALPTIESNVRTALYGMAGLGAIAELPPTPTERLKRGPCWVAKGTDNEALGFVLAGRLGSDVFLETLVVVPAFSRAGMGRALIDAVTGWAREIDAAGMLVSTYRDIPWDAPFYARLGFAEVPLRLWTQQMHRLQREATAIGHDPARRLWMRLALR